MDGRLRRRLPSYQLLVLAVVLTAAVLVGAAGLAMWPWSTPALAPRPAPGDSPGDIAGADSTRDAGSAGRTGSAPARNEPAWPGGGGTPSAPDSADSGSPDSGSPDSGSPDSGSPGNGTPAEQGTDDRDASAEEGRPVVLAVRDIGTLGPVVVDTAGFTLYRYDGDAARTSTCLGACVSTWQPATVKPTDRLDVNGIDVGAVGLLRRPDGELQLTVQGWPVYRFAGDDRPGKHAGQGLGRVWFAITPTGRKAGGS